MEWKENTVWTTFDMTSQTWGEKKRIIRWCLRQHNPRYQFVGVLSKLKQQKALRLSINHIKSHHMCKMPMSAWLRSSRSRWHSPAGPWVDGIARSYLRLERTLGLSQQRSQFHHRVDCQKTSDGKEETWVTFSKFGLRPTKVVLEARMLIHFQCWITGGVAFKRPEIRVTVTPWLPGTGTFVYGKAPNFYLTSTSLPVQVSRHFKQAL